MAESQDSLVQVRWAIPDTAHEKVQKHRRRLAAILDKKVTADEAIADIIKQFNLPDIELKQA